MLIVGAFINYQPFTNFTDVCAIGLLGLLEKQSYFVPLWISINIFTCLWFWKVLVFRWLTCLLHHSLCSSQDVGLWLEGINLGSYRQIFKENGVNGEYLEGMSMFTTEQILRFIRRCHMKWGDFITLCKELRRIKGALAFSLSECVDIKLSPFNICEKSRWWFLILWKSSQRKYVPSILMQWCFLENSWSLHNFTNANMRCILTTETMIKNPGASLLFLFLTWLCLNKTDLKLRNKWLSYSSYWR